MASCVCNAAFRINDQYWVGPLGAKAQAALGASTFVMVLNFALYFLAVAGSMARVTKATGAGDMQARDRAIQHGLALATLVAVATGTIGYLFAPDLVRAIGLSGETANLAVEYIRGTYWMALPIALAPLIDNFFISTGDTRTPLILQLAAICGNFVLNPLLIYGGLPDGATSPSVWMGVEGAAFATGLSRAVVVLVGLYLLHRRGVRLFPLRTLKWGELASVARVGIPSCTSIAIYAGVYLALTERVFRFLPEAALAGFGIGFNAFESVSYPLFLGLSLAGSSLMGQALGRGDTIRAESTVRLVRRMALGLGLVAGAVFWWGGAWLVPNFTSDPEVHAEALNYLKVLAFSQVFVALETASENVLMGSGHTRPIFWISVPGNVARVPLGIWLAIDLGYGSTGLWWAINITTFAKAIAMWLLVTQGRWKGPHRALGPRFGD